MDTGKQISLVRPFDFSHQEYHRSQWNAKDITVLVCQRNTNDLIRLCIESLLRYYPDIKILVVDGDSTDESAFYLKYKAIIHPNLKVWTRKGINSHGMTMDEAIKQHITTKYILLMDSDIIIERGGCIEGILDEFSINKNLYAIGSLMLVTKSGHACGPPTSDADILKYAHPSFSIYDVDMYRKLNAPFVDHGAPCVYNMIAAEEKKLDIAYYPVDKYVSHLCGGSWTEPRTIWPDDHNVAIRPFITFIVNNGIHLDKLKVQTDHDFDIITPGNISSKFIVMYGSEPKKVSNGLYAIRHSVCGEYVCIVPEGLMDLDASFVQISKNKLVDKRLPDELNVGGLMLIKRNLWQKRDSLN